MNPLFLTFNSVSPMMNPFFLTLIPFFLTLNLPGLALILVF